MDVLFYRAASGKEPVREWLKALSRQDRKVIGEDIKTAQYGWPIGMPVVRKLGYGLWEVRSRLDRRIARVLFTVFSGDMILLHGFIKKSRRTPAADIKLANARKADLER